MVTQVSPSEQGWGFAGGDIESKPVAMLGGEKAHIAAHRARD
jgi:hypothetical protein